MKLSAYVVTAEGILALSPAPGRREWMEQTPERFANRCLPLLMANQAGWFVTLTEDVEVEWNGRDGLGDVRVYGGERVKANVASHFGCGIVTFKLPFLFRTEPGYNLLARGPANLFKDGIAPLEGLIESDWSVAPFTMNWKITRPRLRIRFAAGDPVCQLVPQKRHELEAFEPDAMALDDDPAISTEYRQWRESRSKFIVDLAAREEEAVRAGWQRDYFLGRGPGDSAAPQHQTKMSLKGFRKRDGESGAGG
ncbi:MAG: DUF6065 family protein [Polyangiaceae bacterium]